MSTGDATLIEIALPDGAGVLEPDGVVLLGLGEKAAERVPGAQHGGVIIGRADEE